MIPEIDKAAYFSQCSDVCKWFHKTLPNNNDNIVCIVLHMPQHEPNNQIKRNMD